MSTKIHPVAGFILVEPQKQESTTASGIVLPDSHQDKPQQGKVIAIGGTIYNDGREILSPVSKSVILLFTKNGVVKNIKKIMSIYYY